MERNNCKGRLQNAKLSEEEDMLQGCWDTLQGYYAMPNLGL